jgi:sugar-specific transcriptional regulator TrmB
MTIEQLIEIGLTNTQAKAYLALLKHGQISPPELAKLIDEARTNTYSVLDKLVVLKLATQVGNKKKLYKATNPSNLEEFVKLRRLKALEQEHKLDGMLPELMQMYFKVDSEPGIRFFKGKNELKRIYEEQIKSKETIYLIRSIDDLNYYGFDFINKVRLAPAEYGVKRYGLTPDIQTNPSQAADKKSNLERTWVNPKDYDAKVEWTIFGDKISAISFGKEGVGMIIESPQIAESMRQIFELAKAGAKARYPKPKYGYKK